MRFDELAELNPKCSITKGAGAPFADMASLPTAARDVDISGRRIFKGSGSRFRNGDTLIARITPCLENGKGALVRTLPDGQCGHGSTEFIVARAWQPSDSEFIYYVTRHPDFRSVAISRMEGSSGRQRVSWQQIGSIEVPDLSETDREQVGRLLGALDDKIELNRRMSATLEEMARALYQSWFEDFDPVHARALGQAPAHMDETTAALFPDSFGPDGLPKGWEMSTIGEVAETVGGATPKTKEPTYWDGPHRWATPRDLSKLGQPILFETDRTITNEGLARISSGLSPAGTVLLSSRAPIGYVAIAQNPVAVNQGFIALRETDRISSVEAYFWVQSNMDAILANANGSTFQEISKKNFRPLPCVVAPDSVRGAFQNLAGTWFDRVAGLCAESANLAALRDTLLPRLMSGELRVREAEKQVEEAL